MGVNDPIKTVWWKVDLGEVSSIYSIHIQFQSYDGYGMYCVVLLNTTILLVYNISG